jgi:hypothetical protein
VNAETLYAYGSIANVSGSVLMSINTTNGVASRVGSGTNFYGAMAFAPDGSLYGEQGITLVKFNASYDGTYTTLGQLPDYMNAISFDSKGNLWGINSDNFSLYSIDPATGAQLSAKFISSTDPNNAYIYSLAPQSDGSFLSMYGNSLNRLDPATGRNTREQSLSSDGDVQLGLGSAGNLYHTVRGQGFTTLQSIDRASGTVSTIGNSTSSPPATYYYGFVSASPVPVPGAAWLLVSGVGCLGFFRKRPTQS